MAFCAEVPTTVYGDHLRQQVENRLKFYETGEKPEKNADVMARAETEVRICTKLRLKIVATDSG
jgi:nucleolar protein 56